MNNAIPLPSLQHLKSYLQSLQDGVFYRTQIENSPKGSTTNAEIHLTRQLLTYYQSAWGTNVKGSSPEGVWERLNEGSIGERLVTLQIDAQMIDHFIDRYINERQSLFDKTLSTMTGHDVQKLVYQILIELK